jgi:AraC family transcriptional activator of pobA
MITSFPRSPEVKAMRDVPELRAERLPGGERIEVLRFDRRHPRVRLGAHRHRDLELMYFERGGGTHRLGGCTYDAAAGDVLLVTPGLVHDAASLPPATGWTVEFDPQAVGLSAGAEPESGPALSLPRMWWANPLLAPFLWAEQHPTAARFTVPARQRPVWAGHLRVMHREQSARRDGYREMLTAYL